MRADVEERLDRVLCRSPLQAWYRRRTRQALVVLAYHDVVDPRPFRRQLDYLTEHHHPVSLDQVVESWRTGLRLPDAAVLVTFDDGDRSVLDVAAPMLAERAIPAIAFVVAGSLDSQTPFWWEEADALVTGGARSTRLPATDGPTLVRALKAVPDVERVAVLEELRASGAVPSPRKRQLLGQELVGLEERGIEIGNHTLTHPCLPRCDDDKLTEEIDRADARLTSLLGHRMKAFAYPNGDWDQRAEPLLADLGYDAAFLFDHRLAAMRGPDPLRVSRVRVDASASLDRFAIIASGLHPAIHRLRGLG